MTTSGLTILVAWPSHTRAKFWEAIVRLSFFRCVVACVFLSACEIHSGDGDWDWDGSFFDDDAALGRHDAAADDEDAGPGADAGNKRDSGSASAGSGGASGSDAESGGSGDVPPPTPADVSAVLARGRCGALEACMGKELLLESLDGNDCVDYTTAQFADRDLHWLAKAVAFGRVTFRADLLARCEKDIVAQGCDYRNRRLPSSCEDAVKGKADLDEACSIDQECMGNAFCDQGSQATCPGQCAAPQTAGLPCTASDECADGLLCQCPPGTACTNKTCSAPLPEGTACSTLGVRSECPAGLVCQGPSGKLTCQAIADVYAAKLGTACDAFGKLCELGLVCASESTSNTMGTCAEPVSSGSTCRRSLPNQCPADEYCKDKKDGVSTRATPGSDGVCAALPKDSMPCTTDIGCAPGSRCLGDGVCHAFRRAGDACSDSAECYSAECRDGACAAPLECLM